MQFTYKQHPNPEHWPYLALSVSRGTAAAPVRNRPPEPSLETMPFWQGTSRGNKYIISQEGHHSCTNAGRSKHAWSQCMTKSSFPFRVHGEPLSSQKPSRPSGGHGSAQSNICDHKCRKAEVCAEMAHFNQTSQTYPGNCKLHCHILSRRRSKTASQSSGQ